MPIKYPNRELDAAYERIAELEAVLRKCAEHFEYTDAPILNHINMALEPFPIVESGAYS